MKSVIVGTAGHIDHGKTALVKALTGMDADRLEEEKRRGITIDLGFAHTDLLGPEGETLRLGFVDVPGHERFVRNMLAGAGGIDIVLFVVAADESIKPQTREHFDICRMLGVRRGITVLTKSDLVDAETLEVVRLEVGEFVRGSFLDSNQEPIIPVSSRTGAGLRELKAALIAVAAQTEAKDAAALPRLPIDRVFTIKGFGTVVTGTLISGTIHKDEELETHPAGTRVRVRGVQVHGRDAEQAVAGQRTALNLAGIPTDELQRGMALTAPDVFVSCKRVDVSLSLLASAKVLKDRARVHLHTYTSETIAEVFLSGSKLLKPGADAFAQLRLADATLLLPGDRFILRQFSPVVTIGGGVVLDAFPPAKVRRESHEALLRILNDADEREVLRSRISRRAQQGLRWKQAVAETGWRKEIIERAVEPLLESRQVARFGDLYIEAEALQALKAALLERVRNFHEGNPLAPGIGKEALKETASAPAEIFAGALEQLRRENKLEIVGELVRLPGRGVALNDAEAEARKLIEESFSSAGLTVPSLKEVLAGLKVDRARAQKLVTLLLRDKALVKVTNELVFHHTAIENLRAQMASLKSKTPTIDVAQFKEITGVSRKYAIPLLEYLDRERITKRVGDKRVIL
jgi:selenocysteine-specific elongation factor